MGRSNSIRPPAPGSSNPANEPEGAEPRRSGTPAEQDEPLNPFLAFVMGFQYDPDPPANPLGARPPSPAAAARAAGMGPPAIPALPPAIPASLDPGAPAPPAGLTEAVLQRWVDEPGITAEDTAGRRQVAANIRKARPQPGEDGVYKPGHLDVSQNITTLPPGLNVGSLVIATPTLTALPSDLRVESLSLSRCRALTALPNDLRVVSLIVTDCPGLTALPPGLRVRSLTVRGAGLTAIPEGLSVGGRLYLQGCTDLTTLPNNLTVGADLDLRGCTALTTLPNNLTVGGNLDLTGCIGLTTVLNNLTVRGRLCLMGCTGLTTLSDNLTVGGNLHLNGCTGLTTLPNNLTVGMFLDLEGCTALTFPLPHTLRVGVHPAYAERGNAALVTLPNGTRISAGLFVVLRSDAILHPAKILQRWRAHDFCRVHLLESEAVDVGGLSRDLSAVLIHSLFVPSQPDAHPPLYREPLHWPDGSEGQVLRSSDQGRYDEDGTLISMPALSEVEIQTWNALGAYCAHRSDPSNRVPLGRFASDATFTVLPHAETQRLEDGSWPPITEECAVRFATAAGFVLPPPEGAEEGQDAVMQREHAVGMAPGILLAARAFLDGIPQEDRGAFIDRCSVNGGAEISTAIQGPTFNREAIALALVGDERAVRILGERIRNPATPQAEIERMLYFITGSYTLPVGATLRVNASPDYPGVNASTCNRSLLIPEHLLNDLDTLWDDFLANPGAVTFNQR